MFRERTLKKVVATVVAFSLCFCGSSLSMSTKTSAEAVGMQTMESTSFANPVYDASTDTTVWDYVYFGNYPQTQLKSDEITEEILNAEYNEDGDAVINGVKIRRLRKVDATYRSKSINDGFYDWEAVGDYAYFKFEPMKWRVLQNEGDTLLLLSDIVLDCQRYERSDGKITWENCLIRNWLNGTSEYMNVGWNFMATAFSNEEKNAIAQSKLSNPNNPFHGTNGGNSTVDKIFLLSVPEMTNEKYGFPSDYMTYSKTRQLKATDYAKAMGVWMGSHNDLYYGNAIWLLRTPGSYQQTASLVYWFGHVYQDGYYAERPYYGVAPALRVDAKSDLVKKLIPEKTIIKDSINDKFEFDLSNALEALKMALGIDEPIEDSLNKYDFNKDGEIGLDDVLIVLKLALGIPVEEPDVPTQTPKPTPIPPDPVPTLTPSETEPPLVQKDVEPSGRIYIAGDSIAAYHSKSGYSQPLYGWGELIGNYLLNNGTYTFTGDIERDAAQKEKKEKNNNCDTWVYNTALSSRSSRSYTYENNYVSIKNLITEGDYFIISFGHNDERADINLYTDPFGKSTDINSFKWYLKTYYIDPAIRAGAMPVLMSPVPRRYFYNGRFINPQLHTPYGKAMEELRDEYAQQGIKIYFIDLHSYMLDMYEELGEKGTIELHGKYGSTMDNTHLSQKGANIVCEFIARQMVQQNMSYAKFVKDEYK